MVEREKFDHIEERLRVIEGGRNYAFADMAELCLVSDMFIPPKFKVSDFDKYKGTTCLKNHLKMYVFRRVFEHLILDYFSFIKLILVKIIFISSNLYMLRSFYLFWIKLNLK